MRVPVDIGVVHHGRGGRDDLVLVGRRTLIAPPVFAIALSVYCAVSIQYTWSASVVSAAGALRPVAGTSALGLMQAPRVFADLSRGAGMPARAAVGRVDARGHTCAVADGRERPWTLEDTRRIDARRRGRARRRGARVPRRMRRRCNRPIPGSQAATTQAFDEPHAKAVCGTEGHSCCGSQGEVHVGAVQHPASHGKVPVPHALEQSVPLAPLLASPACPASPVPPSWDASAVSPAAASTASESDPPSLPAGPASPAPPLGRVHAFAHRGLDSLGVVVEPDFTRIPRT